MVAAIKGHGTARRIASMIGRLAGSAAEAKANLAADLAQRTTEAKSAKSIILHPGEVRGEYDAARLLMTTLGGKARLITSDDLATFRHNVRVAQGKFKGGITARKVLDFSEDDDRERARTQIKVAVPSFAKNGIARFITNAGPNSEFTRHHVSVEFLGFAQAVSSGSMSTKQAAAWLRKQPIKFDCDCPWHRFGGYRYIATIGGYALPAPMGRLENAYPKIKNPTLRGVACKHALRVMAEIESSGGVLAFLTRLIEKARVADGAAAQIRNTQQNAAKLAKQQAARVRDIKTTDMRQKDRDAARARSALKEASDKAPKPKKTAPASKSTRKTEKAAAILAKQFNLTPAQVMALLASKSHQ